MSLFVEGKLFNKANASSGGGGGDQHNLGWYETPTALRTAHATAEDGDWAIVGSTDTVWVWDSDTTDWVDTDQKGQVTSVNSKTGAVVLTAKDVSAVPQVTSMPTVTEETIVQYTGTTSGSYTNGYFYKATGTTTYTGTVSFDPASISGTTATCSGDDFAGLVAEYGTGNITDIIKGTLTYDLAGGLLVFVGLDDTDTQVCTFQLYTQDYIDAGFVFTGTLADGDVIAFTTTISESTTYSWTRIDVQPAPVIPDPLPSQTGNAGKFLTTDGTDASWATINALQNTATGYDALTILGTPTVADEAINIGKSTSASGMLSIVIGKYCNSSNNAGASIAIGYQTITEGDSAIALGNTVKATGRNSIQIGRDETAVGYTVNSDANTFKVGNANGNFEMMDANGNLPADRLASTTGLADGNYRLRLTMASGVPTLSWVAE